MRRLLIVLGFLLGIAVIGEPLTVAAQTSGKTIKMEIKSEKLTTSLKRLEKVSGYKILFSYDDLSRFTVTNKSIKTQSISQALDILLAGTPLKYEVDGQFVNVYLSETVTRTAQLRPASDGTKVKGRVLDVHGEPVVGAVVRDSRHKLHTTTDIDGHFTLEAPEERVHLSVSYLGMKPTVWTGRRDAFANVVIEDADNSLDDVVVTGYQVLNKRSLTSAVTTVKAEDIMRADALSIDQMLEGHVADMMVMTTSGESGVAPKIRIRGTSSIIGNREPLWVVDGIVVKDPVQVSAEELNDPDYVNRIGNAIAGLNPQDIERLDILKDAAATALYGSKAANGVIVITTKRGREGKPEIRYSNSFTVKMRPRYTDPSVDVMSSKERIQLSRELFASHYEYDDNISPVGYEGAVLDLYAGNITQAQFNARVAQMESMNTDWFDLLTHDSFSQQHTVSMNGGGEKSQYYASIGYVDQDDVVNNQNNKRYTALLNLDTNFTKWLSASFKMQGNVTERNYYQSSLAPVQYAYTTSRAIPAYNADGTYHNYKVMTNSVTGYNYNILNELNNSGVEQNGNSITFDANFVFRFTDWLSANAIGSYSVSNTDIASYWGDKTFYAARLRDCEYGEVPPSWSLMPQGGEYTKDNSRSNSYTVRLQLDWNKYFNDEKHNFNGALGYEMGSTHYKSYFMTARGYYPDRGLSFVDDIDSESFPSYGTWAAQNQPGLTDDLENYVSAYLTMTYSYNRLVYYNINGRIDGNNQFGKYSNNKFLPIWSTSASFNIGQLDFFKKFDWLDYFTFKASFGYQGNMPSGQSPVMLIRKGSMSNFYNEFVSNIVTNPNPNLKWERTNSWNFGLDAAFLDGRIALGASVYFKRTKDAFMQKAVATVNGMDSYIVNGGNVDNDGWSVDLTVTPVRSKDWRWTLSTTFSREINRLRTTPAGESYELSDFLNGTAVVKGQAIGTFYSYRFLGLSPVDGGPMFDDWGEHYNDLEGLSKYDTYTKVLKATGSRYPTMSGGLSTSLRYKTFRLSASFAYSLGAKTRLFGMYGSKSQSDEGALIYNAGSIRPENNMSRDYLDRWMKPGDEAHTNIPALLGPGQAGYYKYTSHWSSSASNVQTIANSYWDMYDYSDYRVASADYLKLQTLSLSWELPKTWVSRLTLKRIEVKAAANNLFTICDSKLKGQTPTQGGFTTIELSERPSFSFGLDITL